MGYLNKVELDFSRPGSREAGKPGSREAGKPTDNAFIEVFNAHLRSKCLNASWFPSMADARSRIDAWREDDNHHRAHTSLGNLTPAEFADLLRRARELS